MDNIENRVKYNEFLSQHDMLWETLPKGWRDAPFAGNGLMGTYMFGVDKKTIVWEICRTDVIDNRQNEDTPLYAKRRLPIGKIILSTQGDIISSNTRLDLYKAEFTTNITTDKGELKLITFVHSEEDIIAIQINTSGNEEGCKIDFVPQKTKCIERIYSKIKEVMPDPDPISFKDDGVNYTKQSLLSGGGYVAAWQRFTLCKDCDIAFISVGMSDDIEKAKSEAIFNVKKAISTGIEMLKSTHQSWWDNFYSQSFLSIPDTRLESFYWIQIYKLGSATRENKPAIDLLGPWYCDSPWLIIWWNLNIQLTYWPVLASNHLDLGLSLTKMLSRNIENLSKNVPTEFQSDCAAIGRTSSYDCLNDDLVGKEFCNLPWVCHNIWLQYRYSMDRVMLKNELFPLLKKTMNFYIKNLKKGEDGKLHLPQSISPEYSKLTEDCNIDLALIRWGVNALIEICDILKIDDELMPVWKDVLEKLVEYQIDETGLMIGRGVPLEESHRHYSHLFPIFPLYLINWEQDENKELIERSVDRWINLAGKLEGYTYTGAASMCSTMGRADLSLQYMNELIDKYLEANTMYLEAGPVIETPLSGAKSIQDMLIQSWGELIRIFPSVPSNWENATIHNMRTEGAFLISGTLKDGKVRFVKIKSLAGEPCKFRVHIDNPVVISENIKIKMLEANTYEANLLAGDELIICEKGYENQLILEPVKPEKNRCNFFGGVSGLIRKDR